MLLNIAGLACVCAQPGVCPLIREAVEPGPAAIPGARVQFTDIDTPD